MARTPKNTETVKMADPVESPVESPAEAPVEVTSEVTSEVTEAAPETAPVVAADEEYISPATRIEMETGAAALKKYQNQIAAE